MEDDDAPDARCVIARFAGKCWNCGSPTVEGERIWYSPSLKKATHKDCGRPVLGALEPVRSTWTKDPDALDPWLLGLSG